MKFVSEEEISKQKAEFYERYPGRIWKAYEHSYQESDSIKKSIDFLLNTQNGADVDDYVITEYSSFVSKLKDQFNNQSVLIIGTGTGREMKYARKCGASAVEGLTMGQRNQLFANEIVGENPLVADMHMLPWSNESFTMIVAFQVLEHSYAPPVFLLECNRVLKIGGIIHIETPPSSQFSFDSWLHHVLCPTPRQLFCLLMKTGFKPVEYNGKDIVNVSPNEENDWFDNTTDMLYMKAEKMNPMNYQRGDMARYYNMLSGEPFKL